ncbi:hypothetical protein Pcinc_010293 [Petrolisthes cinctipes]|uniref:Uncharacterized protein n=1 Tax=Petrolisthes cinctipes TaxID=88211 RepID=A0AAE1G363_PETCI|nr:hypothetical protein Pcinc_010293 [Petrolisthes cinctipes]
MVLPRSEKDRIAGMIMQGIEHHKILERVRETSGRNRTSILEKKDMENIIAAYGLSVNQSHHSDDSTSVRLIAQDMKDAGELLYFKDQGELDPQNTEIPSEEFVLAFMKEGQQLMFSEQLKNTEKLQTPWKEEVVLYWTLASHSLAGRIVSRRRMPKSLTYSSSSEKEDEVIPTVRKKIKGDPQKMRTPFCTFPIFELLSAASPLLLLYHHYSA